QGNGTHVPPRPIFSEYSKAGLVCRCVLQLPKGRQPASYKAAASTPDWLSFCELEPFRPWAILERQLHWLSVIGKLVEEVPPKRGRTSCKPRDSRPHP